MASVTLEGETLRQRQRYFNKLVKEAVENKRSSSNISDYDYDVTNLLKIDIACANRDIHFILEILKCKDILYISRAIKHSTWLITEDQYSHIINIDYIHTNLFPRMTLKAFNKFMLKIRIHLKDEKRVDNFFNYFYEHDLERALKWLPNCSDALAEDIVAKHYDKIPFSVLKKFKRDSNCVYIYCKKQGQCYRDISKELNLLKHNNIQKYLGVAFDIIDSYSCIDKFTPQSTREIVKKCPDKDLNYFLKYKEVIHIPTLVKFFSCEQIKQTLIENSRSKKYESLYKYDKLKYFVDCLSPDDKYDLIKNVFINQIEPVYTRESDLQNSTLIRCLTNMNNAYLWCELLPFDEAFEELKRYIEIESNPVRRAYMFCILLSSARKNYDHIQIVLEYYVNNYIQEGLKFKTQFLQHLLRETNPLKFNSASWELLNCLFNNVNVYRKMDNKFPKYRERPFVIIGRRRRNYSKRELQSDDIFVNCIVLYSIVNDIQIPDFIMSKFKFNTFKKQLHKLTESEKQKVFEFLFTIVSKVQDSLNFKDENKFEELMLWVEQVLELSNDFNKDLDKFPTVKGIIEEFIKRNIQGPNKHEIETLCDYKKLKYIMKEMDDSYKINCYMKKLNLNPQKIIDLQQHDDVYKTKSVQRFLRKIRVFWHELANELKENSLKKLEENPENGHKNIPWNLFSEKEVLNIMQKYFTIGQNDTNIIIKKAIAQNLHLLRPRFTYEKAFQYCKAENLVYFLPSLHSLLYDINPYKIHEIFVELNHLSTSRKVLMLKKHCFQIALKKIGIDRMKNDLMAIWNSEKRPTRVLIFKYIYVLLCKAKDTKDILKYWNVLSKFIDNLNEHDLEATSLVKTLSEYTAVPYTISEEYYEKVLTFLQSQPNKKYLDDFKKKGEFGLEQKVKDFHKVLNKKPLYAPYWVSEYLFLATSKEVQMKRYEKLFIPIMDKLLSEKQTLIALIRQIYRDIDNNVIRNGGVVPLGMFTDLQERLEKVLPFFENYVLITSGRLFLVYLRIVEKHLTEKIEDVEKLVLEEFGEYCADYLDGEIETHFPLIYLTFSDALKFLFNAMDKQIEMTFIDAMLRRNSRAECFLALIDHLPRKSYRTPDEIKFSKTLEKMKNHPSEEVQMLYSNYFIRTESM